MEKFGGKAKGNWSMQVSGSQNLRMRLLLSTLKAKPITIRDIRADALPPGLLDHEISLISLLVKISYGCIIEINDTGTSLRNCPGPLKDGDLKHDCGTSRSIGYFLEPLIVLGLFGDKPLNIKLEAEKQAGKSRGYGFSLVATTTTGCCYSADTAVSCDHADEVDDFDDETRDSIHADDVALLNEIKRDGVVDSTHQGLLFLLCALCPTDVSKVRVGELTPHGIEVLREIKEFLGVVFDKRPDPDPDRSTESHS